MEIRHNMNLYMRQTITFHLNIENGKFIYLVLISTGNVAIEAVATASRQETRASLLDALIARSSSTPPRLNRLKAVCLVEFSVLMAGRGSSKPWWRRGALLRGIPKHYSVRTRLRMALQFSPLGTAWEVFQTLFAVLVSALYVIETYRPEVALSLFDSVALGVFGVDYALNLYCSESRCGYPLR